ncbi:hypothetical protein [Mycobacterium sp. NAZ190054]|uniref:hypothetical protein n=1 Tax=Mycobacterium sp. NAZ190054 TaxID=1747766 RepID=UPI000AA33F48|nr:hypothetical protein [Mycobacterium sp. NAZ190054]
MRLPCRFSDLGHFVSGDLTRRLVLLGAAAALLGDSSPVMTGTPVYYPDKCLFL